MSDSIARRRQATRRGASVRGYVKIPTVEAAGEIVASTGVEVALIAAGIGTAFTCGVFLWDWCRKREHERRMVEIQCEHEQRLAEIAARNSIRWLPALSQQENIYGFLHAHF